MTKKVKEVAARLRGGRPYKAVYKLIYYVESPVFYAGDAEDDDTDAMDKAMEDARPPLAELEEFAARMRYPDDIELDSVTDLNTEGTARPDPFEWYKGRWEWD